MTRIQHKTRYDEAVADLPQRPKPEPVSDLDVRCTVLTYRFSLSFASFIDAKFPQAGVTLRDAIRWPKEWLRGRITDAAGKTRFIGDSSEVEA